MSKWSIDFGMVQMWDDNNGLSESGEFKPVNLKITYNDTESFHLSGEWRSETAKGFISSARLDIKRIGDDGLVAISGNSFILSQEQLKMLYAVDGTWVYESGDTSEIPVTDRKPRYPCPNDLGIVYWYSNEKDSYVLADFKIDFDWQTSKPIIFFIADYGESMMPEGHRIIMTESLEVEYLGENNGYHAYSVSGESLLLTVEQAAFINNLVARI